MNGENINANVPNESPMADLENEKPFGEHLADSTEEQKSEYEKVDSEIFEGIRSIENKADRDLATAILPLYYSSSMGEDGTRSDADLSKMETMGTLVNYMHGDKAEPLYLRHKLFGVLERGHKIENFETFGKESNSNGYTSFEVPGREYGANFYFKGNRVDFGEKAVTATLANDIAERLQNPKNDGDREIDTAELDMLSKAYELGEGDYYREHPVEGYVDNFKRTAAHEMSVKMRRVMNEYNSGQAEVSINVKGEGGVANYLAAEKLANEFSGCIYAQKVYRSNLEIGKQILDGADWREIERPNLAQLRFGEKH